MGGALEAREIAAGEGKLTAIARGEVEAEEGVLVLRRIHVVFTLNEVSGDKFAAAERAHEAFKPKCPVYRSLYRAIDITTELSISGREGSPTP